MEKQYKVGIVGATGMVGQRFVTLLENHPWFKLTVLAASGRSAGKTYEEAVGPRWAMTSPMPESVKKMVVLDASKVEEVASQVDFIFCAVNMPKDEIKALEEAYAKAECPVVSNNSANRFTPDVPMMVPEINADHIEIIPAQRKRLGTKRGFIAVKSNCSLQSYVPALHPLMKDFGVSKALVCTYQAISGAGKTFDRMPEIVDNVIPYIGGEEEKSEREPLKLCAPAPCSAPAALAAAPGGAGDSLESNIVPAGAAGPAAKLMPDVSSAAASALRALLCGASPANVAESSGLASSCQAAMTSSLCPMLTYMAYIARPLVSLGLEVNTLYVSVPLGQESLNGMTDPMTDKTPWPSGGLTV